MSPSLRRLIDSPRAVPIASAISLALGLVFTFVWAPHPWGWQGIDQYHELARGLARGEPFATTDVPWGYAYYVAAFYALFGEHAWMPVLAQVLVNASVPGLLYLLIAPAAGRRTAALAALLAGIFSFNTVYASTQSSDALCTVLFLASLVLFVRGLRTASVAAFAVAGLLSGLVPQFRPNMILFPIILVAVALFLRPNAQRATRMAVFLAVGALALSPWVVRNYRLTGLVLPTSTHGGVQLWYGTLQVGPYLNSRAHNPRSAFESAAFDYTSLADRSIVVSADPRACGSWEKASIALVYWTDRDPRRVRVTSVPPAERPRFEIPGQPSPTTLFYFFEVTWPSAGGAQAETQATPPDGATNPLIFFVADDHLGDLDRHGNLLDVFDVVRLVQQAAWNGGGEKAERDVAAAVNELLAPDTQATSASYSSLRVENDAAVLALTDGSSLTIPRHFSGRVTDLGVAGNLATALIAKSRRSTPATPGTPDPCRLLENVRVNDVFYRKEPHQMRRYMALALDNIAREPVAFLAASAYRAGRLFIIRGSDDRWTAQQFSGSTLAYGAGLVLSTIYLLAFLAGVFVAWRQRSPLLYLLIPIVYVPLTICFVLTNMRYTITVQPLMFAFVALAGVKWLELHSRSGGASAPPKRRA